MDSVNILCMKWGTKYGPDYVNTLHAMVGRNLSRPYRFVCLTDDPTGIDPHIETRPLPVLGVPEFDTATGWTCLHGWLKVTAFATPLIDLLSESPLPIDNWNRIGTVIAGMHALGVHHADLNCRNILLDGAGRIWLIDFDKCKRCPPGRWARQNLARLERSLSKEKAKQPSLFWSPADRAALLDGYRRSSGH